MNLKVDVEGIGPYDKEVPSAQLDQEKAPEKEVCLGEVDQEKTPEKEAPLAEVEQEKAHEKEVPLVEVDQERKAHDYNVTKSTEFTSSERKKQGNSSVEEGTNEVVSETTLSASSPNDNHEALLELSIESVLDDPTFKNLYLLQSAMMDP